MRIIVIQRHKDNLIGIQHCIAKINRERSEEIIYTTSPGAVVGLIKNGDPAIVVSGQILGFGEYGTDLAHEVKRLNPKTLFFIYSVIPPEKNDAVDGIVPRELGTLSSKEHHLLAKILAGDIASITPDGIKNLIG